MLSLSLLKRRRPNWSLRKVHRKLHQLDGNWCEDWPSSIYRIKASQTLTHCKKVNIWEPAPAFKYKTRIKRNPTCSRATHMPPQNRKSSPSSSSKILQTRPLEKRLITSMQPIRCHRKPTLRALIWAQWVQFKLVKWSKSRLLSAKLRKRCYLIRFWRNKLKEVNFVQMRTINQLFDWIHKKETPYMTVSKSTLLQVDRRQRVNNLKRVRVS